MHTTQHNNLPELQGQQSQGSPAQAMHSVAGVAGAMASGNPIRVWEAARTGTENVASTLPDSFGLDHVKHFVRRHPVLSTCVVLLVAYTALGELLPGAAGLSWLTRKRS